MSPADSLAPTARVRTIGVAAILLTVAIPAADVHRQAVVFNATLSVGGMFKFSKSTSPLAAELPALMHSLSAWLRRVELAIEGVFDDIQLGLPCGTKTASKLGLPGAYVGQEVLQEYVALSERVAARGTDAAVQQVLHALFAEVSHWTSGLPVAFLVEDSEPVQDPSSWETCGQRVFVKLRSSLFHMSWVVRGVAFGVMNAYIEQGCGGSSCIVDLDVDVPLAVLPARPTCSILHVLMSEIYTADVLLNLARGRAAGRAPRIIEVGVGRGDLTEELLEQDPQVYVFAVDPWEHAGDGLAESGEASDLNSAAPVEHRALEVMAHLDRFRPRVAFLPSKSTDVAPVFATGSVDLAYIDGDQRPESVEADLAAWARVVAPTGVLAGGGYSLMLPFVVLAVRAFATQHDLALHLGNAGLWWIDFAEAPCKGAPTAVTR